MKKIVLGISVALAFGGFTAQAAPPASAPAVPAATNTNDAAIKAAERYEQVTNQDKLMDDMFNQLQSNPQLHLSPDEVNIIKQSIDKKEMKTVLTNALVSNFTVKELDALTAFYSTPEGKSIMNKMPVYMAQIMPYVQNTAVKAVMTYMQQKKMTPSLDAGAVPSTTQDAQ